MLVKHLIEQPFDLRPPHRVNAVANRNAFNSAFDNAHVFELPQVLANGGLRQAQLSHQVAIDAGIGAKQMVDDGNPGWVSESFRYLGQVVLLGCKEISFGNSQVRSVYYIAILR